MRRPFFGLALVLLVDLCFGQIQLRHIEDKPAHSSNARTENTLLTLPFWDDFSQSSVVPDSNLWSSGENVFINNSLPINQPSINVASFDGTDALGNAYAQNSIFSGAGDSLVTQPINMTNISKGERETVYLSFYWQLLGRGELPEPEDSLMVMFYRNDSIWIPQDLFPDDSRKFSLVGGRDNIGIGPDSTQLFQQIMLPVDNDRFYHAGFKIKFQSFSSLNGIYDTWHLDYIYVNKGRSEDDQTHLDRTVAAQPTSLFAPYSEIPSFQYLANPNQYQEVQSTTVNNLDDTPHPLEYSHTITNLTTGDEITTGNQADFRMSPLEFGRKIEGLAISPDLVSEDSTVLESFFIYNTGDNYLYEEIDDNGDTLFYNIDLKTNDTVKQRYTLHEHYAYDDGIADFAAGINIISGQLAVRFVVDEPDTLTGMLINFPAINTSTQGQALDISVWYELEENGQALAQSYQINNSSRTGFDSIKFVRPIYVTDTIYIGFKQFSEQYIGVGFDKDLTGGKDAIFFNTERIWEQNTALEGSLMIRAVFDKAEQFVLSTKPTEPTIVYPNPTTGLVNVTGKFEEYSLISLSGREIERGKYERTLDFNHLPDGLYLLRLINQQNLTTYKIQIRK